ncbi:hypothetical protein HDU93_006222 [Gonapodya sp. JEL0774]|nr:hypothetical protein HDU93_006222 [Gonapodya sp. JEL0774]
MSSPPPNLTDLPTETILHLGDYLPFRLGLPTGALNRSLAEIFRTPQSIAARAIAHFTTPARTLLWESARTEPGQHRVIKAVHERLLRRHPDLNLEMPADDNILRGALQYQTMVVSFGDPQRVKATMTPLMAAVSVGNVQSVLALLELGANPQGEGWRLGHPLVLACAGESLEVVRLLLEKGGHSEKSHGPLLSLCSSMGKVDHVQLLLNHGADPNVGALGGLSVTALILAAQQGHLDIVKLLVDHGADVSQRNNSALWYAVRRGGLEMVKFLLKNGADSKANSPHKRGAFKDAEKNGHEDVLKYIRAYRRQSTGTDDNGGTN